VSDHKVEANRGGKPVIDITGDRYGKWTVIGRANVEGMKATGAYWHCICDCGNAVIVYGASLRNGVSRGCLACRPKPQRAEFPTYIQAHKRLRRDRGPASIYDCVECSGPAAEWALIENPSERLIGDHHGRDATYSRNPDDYQPMCARDHRRMDAWLRGARATRS